MRRSEALKQLSREHHQALVFSKKLTMLNELGIEDQGAAWEKLRSELRIHLLPHFAEEEAMLEALGVETDRSAPVIRFHTEHRDLRNCLDSSGLDSVLPMAELLKQHVRFEERELFNWLETEFGDEYLMQVIAK